MPDRTRFEERQKEIRDSGRAFSDKETELRGKVKRLSRKLEVLEKSSGIMMPISSRLKTIWNSESGCAEIPAWGCSATYWQFFSIR